MSGFVNQPKTSTPLAMGKYQDGDHTNGHHDSPLRVFVIAKKSINESFDHISFYVNDSIHFLKTGQSVISQEKVNETCELVDMVNGIRDVLARDHMKVAFFGRTSNGKSTVINAVLGNKILPSGMGHTTNCFLQVEGTDLDDAYLITEDEDKDTRKRKNVESVSSLANALSSEKLDDASLVRIFWPKTKCKILRDDVVLVDSPGIDVSPNLDEWIDKHCLSADVFVLVSNAESTLMRTEKAFFHKVSSKLSNPNIFILNNRWDAVASEPENEEAVRKQHFDREVAFLCEELNVIDRQEAANRVFFVSAKEVLQNRMQNNPNNSILSGGDVSSLSMSSLNTSQPSSFVDGHQNRLQEFEEFERKFEECLSKSAIRTKFDQHTKRGEKIVLDVKDVLQETHKLSEESRNKKLSDRSEVHHKLKTTSLGLDTIRLQITSQIRNLVDSVESKVSSALNEEIRRLSLLVNEYEKPFNPEPLFLAGYKKDLHLHVERGLGSNLKARLSTALTSTVDAASNEMMNQVLSILPADSEMLHDPSKSLEELNSGRKSSAFEVFYRLNCDSLCSDFQEDLEFRFSLGLISMIKKFSNRNPFKKKATIVQNPSLDRSGYPADAEIFTSSTTSFANESMMLMLIERATNAAPQSQTTLGALALGGFMVKTIGWKIIGLTCGIYALLYIYERLTWTNAAQEKAFKRQYVQHATRKLKLIVDLTSANCSHQVQQELTSTFGRLCHLVDETIKQMDTKLHKLDTEIENLSISSKNSLKLKNEADVLLRSLDEFAEKYLKDRT